MINSSLIILLAEDSQDDITLFRMALEKANVQEVRLQTVRDGEEAIAYLSGAGIFCDRAAHPLPDIVLLDLNMPRLNGFEVLQWIRQEAKFNLLMVDILTTSSREADVRRAYELRANSYVIKPSRVNDLVILIQRFVAWHCCVSLPKISPENSLPTSNLPKGTASSIL